MNKIIFDLTHLVNWQGNLTGIPRTTDEIARRLRLLDNTIFVAWDSLMQEYSIIDIDYYYNHTEPLNRAFFSEAMADKTEPKEKSLKHGVKLLIIKHLPTLARLGVKSKKSFSVKEKKKTISKTLSKGVLSPARDDIFFIPCGTWDDSGYINKTLSFKKMGCKVVFICYDLLPIVVPQFSGQWGAPMKDFIKRVVAKCDLVFAISEHTKKDMINWLSNNNLNAPSIKVIHLGDTYETSKPIKPKCSEFNRSKIGESGEPFILCPGTVEARKNHVLLYYTYKLAKSRNVSVPKLIIVGRSGYRTENIIDIIRDDPDVNKDIFILTNVNDNELSWLYKKCKFTIYPSFYEGWGLPIAESVVQGIPCICSNTSSMTEVAPGIPDYFNPSSPEECLVKIVEYQNPKVFKQAQARTKLYRPTSWDYSFDQIINSLKVNGIYSKIDKL